MTLPLLILIASVLGTSVVMHLRVRSYVIASILGCCVGSFIGGVAYYIIVLDFEPGFLMYLPLMIIVMAILSSPAPFIVGLCVRLARRRYRKRRGVCLKCGSKRAVDMTVPCPDCDWLRESIRQGLCPQCRYDLQGDFSAGCSECGWRREAPSS